MKITPYLVEKLIPYVITTRSGRELIELFNKYGSRDVYDKLGLPDIGKPNEQRPSRTEYARQRLLELSGKNELRDLLTEVLMVNIGEIDSINDYLIPEGYKVSQFDDRLIIQGGVIDNRQPVVNQAHFNEIQDQILAELDKAEVSIWVVIAWFTNVVLFNKLIEKLKNGVDVRVAMFDDGVNRKHGVDISQLPNTLIKRGKRGGLMHDKFCVIDNQVVITGSYNWTTNAEFRNDENITIEHDPKQATRFSVEYIKLTR